jgi:hypothetical protein
MCGVMIYLVLLWGAFWLHPLFGLGMLLLSLLRLAWERWSV